MSVFMRKNGTGTIMLGPFVSKADGVTPITNVTAADIKVCKNGDAGVAFNGFLSAHTADGWYGCYPDASDTNETGDLLIYSALSTALPVWIHAFVVTLHTWNSLVTNVDNLQVDAVQIEGSDATDQINAAMDAALDTAIPGSPTADSINERIKALDVLAEASGDGDLAAIKTKADQIGSVDMNVTTNAQNGADLEIIQGDDYTSSNYLTITVTGWTGTSVDGLTATLTLDTYPNYTGTSGTSLDLTCTASQSGTTVTMNFTATAAQTGALEATPSKDSYNYRYQVYVVDGSSKRYTLVHAGRDTGRCTVYKKVS